MQELVQTLLKQLYLFGHVPSPPVSSHATVLTIKILDSLGLLRFMLEVRRAGRLKQIC